MKLAVVGDNCIVVYDNTGNAYPGRERVLGDTGELRETMKELKENGSELVILHISGKRTTAKCSYKEEKSWPKQQR